MTYSATWNHEYTFQTETEYAAFTECMTEHDGWLEARTDEEVDRLVNSQEKDEDNATD